MDKTAQELASKGRYGDSMLVHMAPEEVAGIASLGGVSMNPETGLPEMFKFKDFMKFAAPIALSVALPGAGAALGGAGGALSGTATGTFLKSAVGKAVLSGLGSGLGSLMTGSNRDEALQSGMTAGLTYGLASKVGQGMQGQQQVAPPKTEQIIREGGAQAMDPSSVNVAPKPTMADALSRNQSSAVGGASQPVSIASGRFADPSGGEYGNLMKQAADNQGLISNVGVNTFVPVVVSFCTGSEARLPTAVMLNMMI